MAWHRDQNGVHHRRRPQNGREFEPGPASTSRKARRTIRHRDGARASVAGDGPMVFLGASGAQVKGPIDFRPPSAFQPVRNKFLQAPGFTFRKIA